MRTGAVTGLGIALLAASACGRDRRADIVEDPAPRADAVVAIDASADGDEIDAPRDVATDARPPPIEIHASHAPPTTGPIRAPWNDRDALGRAVADPFGRCYADALLRDPMLAGTIVVRFSALPDGSIDAPAAGGGTMHDAEILDCVVAVLRRLEIAPPPPSRETIDASFAFRPR